MNSLLDSSKTVRARRGPRAVVATLALGALLVGLAGCTENNPPPESTTVVTPAPSTTPVAVPGPPGPSGAPGAHGASGAPGAPGASAPA
nr:hypothetical protein [Armatimonadota bacterium]